MRRAPLLIVPMSNKDAYLDRYAEPDKGWTDRDESRWPVPYWDVDAGMAALLMLLTAVDEGLGACFFGVPPERVDAFRAAFGVPDDVPAGRLRVGRLPRATTTVAPRRCAAAGAGSRRSCTVAAGDGGRARRAGHRRLARHRPGDRAGLRRAGRPGRGALRPLAGPRRARCSPSCPAPGHVLVQADMADADAVGAMVDRAAAELGGLDVLVNNAGVFTGPPAAGRRPTTTGRPPGRGRSRSTSSGAANATFRAVPHLIAAGGGAVVNVSSRGAFRGEPNNPAYGASKAGMNAFAQSMALALAPQGISVTCVAPGFVQTEMAREVLDGPGGRRRPGRSRPFGRVARPEEVASAVLWLASPEARFSSRHHRRRQRRLRTCASSAEVRRRGDQHEVGAVRAGRVDAVRPRLEAGQAGQAVAAVDDPQVDRPVALDGERWPAGRPPAARGR